MKRETEKSIKPTSTNPREPLSTDIVRTIFSMRRLFNNASRHSPGTNEQVKITNTQLSEYEQKRARALTLFDHNHNWKR
ncbi:hypothetical protein GTO27_07435 [Candidatus Bathyarchaeota archaeon]|nr:hypothetical protein [Candidatus Bathyarchaeota archaeon]